VIAWKARSSSPKTVGAICKCPSGSIAALLTNQWVALVFNVLSNQRFDISTKLKNKTFMSMHFEGESNTADCHPERSEGSWIFMLL
jgi:hypothetical protein